MCMHGKKLNPISRVLEKHPGQVLAGSRRRRLWELPHNCHCPVIGVCLPMPVLRKAINRLVGDSVVASDYEWHVSAVNMCTQRTPITEVLERVLDRRYALTITRFKSAKTTEALMHMWKDAITEGKVPGALWASLTHPCCDAALHEDICRDIHMIQHHAGACATADLARQAELEKRCATLQQELAQSKAQHARILADKHAEISRLGRAFMKSQASLLGKDTVIDALRQELDELRHSVPDLDCRVKLKEKNQELASRLQAFRTENEELRQRLKRNGQPDTRLSDKITMSESPYLQIAAEVPGVDASEAFNEERASPAASLSEKNVLCVGGRTGSIATYRKIVEDIGGKFAHHDGGLEDSASLLDKSLAAADLVICQTGCIGHSAYWRVKDHCKRTGKQCVFIDNPSASSLARGLDHMAFSPAIGIGCQTDEGRRK